MCLNAGAMGRRDAETETLIPTTGGIFDVAHAIQAGALRENPLSGPDGVGVQEGIAYTLEARSEVQAVAHALRGEGFDASEDGTGRGTPIVPVQCFDDPRRYNGPHGGGFHGEVHPTLESTNPKQAVAYRTSPNCGAWETGDRVDALTTGTDPTSHVIAFSSKDYGNDAQDGLSPTLRSMGHDGSHANGGGQVAIAMPEPYTIMERGREGGSNLEFRQDGTSNAILTPNGGRGGLGVGAIAAEWAVRRLTPRECERLQGFPDDHTRIAWRKKPEADCPDGPRYKAVGNSMAVNVMRHIGQRIAEVDQIP